MMRAIVFGVALLALAGPASATSMLPRPGSPTQGAAPAAPSPTTPEETPSMLRDALSGLRLFHLHQGRDGVDPAANARERPPVDPSR
jgi:hypothetical protein